jgi:2-dehydro-3-deoxygluconokinase
MDVLTFGESLVVFNPEVNGPLRYVNNFAKSVGGAESNVAIALARLGHNVGWFSKLGKDEFGRYLQNYIRGEGVDVTSVAFTDEANTGILFKERFASENPNVYYYRKNSAASMLSESDINEQYIKKAKIVHITGITPALSDSARKAVFKVISICKENGIMISFDPNIRLKLWSLEEAKPVLLDIARQADIIFPGASEGEMLLGTADEKEIASKFIELGSKIVAVKLGAEGSYVADGIHSEYVKGFKIEKVIDSVGAGDGFAAGFLSGMINKLELKECANLANAVGAMATLVNGDNEGYPCLEQLMEFMGKKKAVDR